MDKWLKRRKLNDDNSNNDNVSDQINDPRLVQVKILRAPKNTLFIGYTICTMMIFEIWIYLYNGK